MDSSFHFKKIDTVIQDLKTNLDDGLIETEAQGRLITYGYNILPTKEGFSIFKLLLKQLKDFMILVLIAASMVSYLIHDIKDAIIIMAVVIINTLLGFLQEYKAEKTIEALKRTASPKAKVIRDGKYKMIPTGRIVPGDILILEEGDIVQADGRIFEVVNLSTQESFLTGESLPVEKMTRHLPEKAPLASRRNIIFRGSTITQGHGKAIVTATGKYSELGKIAHLITQIKDKPTPLELKLQVLGKNLVMLTVILCLLIATIGILQGLPAFMMIETAIVLAVACIPEGLVAVTTIALALGIQRMAKKNAIIRRLPAVETLGSVTTICSDKTGTLTEGKMAAQYIYIGDQILPLTGSYPISQFLLAHEDLKLLFTIAMLCNNATLQKKGNTWEVFGDPTEGALKLLAVKAGFLEEPLLEQFTFVSEAPFDARRKCMSKIYKTAPHPFIFTKGAPEQIFKLSKPEQLQSREAAVRKVTNDFASKGFRVLAFAYRPLTETDLAADIMTYENNLTFLGLIAIADPIREEALSSIERCKQAGIKTMIVTGDHQHTANYVAKQLRMVQSDHEVINSQRLESLPDDEFDKAVREYKVLSRVSPHLKLRIVESLRRQGEIVAMTGDGINDAPAIKRANVGIAMGLSGTDVAKEAADIVLADDNFTTIVSAIEEGRTIYSNILKFIRYLLACNMGEIFMMLLASLFRLPFPFLPIQILWLNLVTDTPPALALGVDPAPPDGMKKPPRSPKEPIFSKSLMNDILMNGLVMALITLGIFYIELFIFHESLKKARTLAFATTVLVQLLHAFNCQSHEKSIFSIGLFTNKYLLGGILFSLVLLLIGMYLPWLKDIFGQEGLTLKDWIFSFFASCGILVSVEIQKWVRSHQIFNQKSR
ncbi:MAG: hypothetical protein A2Z91_05935 [Deltaproteobacteria bacterium GWA2_38_16]|nr:MAG: hypothetical protein A2Z91_05935 [Deltaproteobacteria bacterium GWA2_38_16]OGQ02652.1 MAG: hypothetical protein A3D19_05230 [Deltaproteobacteria bacterium RIFCSPHIGHO2_02_FULL_38_15]OGQ60313.1 MAG: hypothetical protein A3G92_06075 [Deltaproteobacteria bacterium RIFCSPLOWO2_12_FULL_38_8]HBQ21335.1 ATPase [Deltaproteobacteria bacterium]